MSEFTDDDLSRLKCRKSPQRITKPEILGLISRLEAAEKVINLMGSDPLSGEVSKSYEAWCKAKGG